MAFDLHSSDKGPSLSCGCAAERGLITQRPAPKMPGALPDRLAHSVADLIPPSTVSCNMAFENGSSSWLSTTGEGDYLRSGSVCRLPRASGLR
jgi:hypothetical protein